MKKRTAWKSVLALLLAVTLLLSLSVAALAAGPYSISITNSTTGYTYEAYQVFTGDFADGTLSNVEWGDGVDSAALLTALQGDTTTGVDFTACTTAAQVAKAISTASATMSSAQKEALAKLINNNRSTTAAGTATAPNGAGAYVIDNLAGGYYLVVNTDAPENAELSRFMLQVLDDVTVVPKADRPVVEKDIVDADGDNPTSANTVSIGDTVHYKITSAVPNMAGYTKYFFIVNDTLSKGLTYDAGTSNLTVKVGTTTLTLDTDYTVTIGAGADDSTTLKIVFKDFYTNYKDQVGAEIVITYDAVLNTEAETGVDPNTNTVTLSYSTDPSIVPVGTDEPGTGDPPLGESPESTTYTYTTELTITKTDEDDNILPGAEFTLTGTAMNIVVVSVETFTLDNAGTYYKLNDGTYTTEAPNGVTEHDAAYASLTDKYVKSVVFTPKGTNQTETAVTGMVDSVTGELTFTGLGIGTYVLSETKTPAGYNTMDDITFTISAAYDANWTPTFTATAPITVDGTTGALAVTIQNIAGNTLPSTGGIGTTLFYILGSILAVGAAILLVTRKRMSNNER